jgi:hypothetical protein
MRRPSAGAGRLRRALYFWENTRLDPADPILRAVPPRDADLAATESCILQHRVAFRRRWADIALANGW